MQWTTKNGYDKHRFTFESIVYNEELNHKILVVKKQDPPKDEQHVPVTYLHQDLIVNTVSFIEMYLKEPIKYIIHQN